MITYDCEYCSKVNMTLEEKTAHDELHIVDGEVDESTIANCESMSVLQMATVARQGAIEFGVDIMNNFIDEPVRLGTNPDRTREYFETYDAIDAIRCSNIISKSGDSLGEYDFFFEWFIIPTNEQVLTLIEHIEEALSEIDVRYTITTK